MHARQIAEAVAAIAGGYAFGMIPSADLATGWASAGGTNLRDTGSANPGALNATKTLGKKWGGAVLLADVAKGVAAASAGRALAGPAGANLASSAAVAGHCYPLGRSGGKGVSTSIGQVIGTFPVYLPLDIAVGVATAAMPKWTTTGIWAGLGNLGGQVRTRRQRAPTCRSRGTSSEKLLRFGACAQNKERLTSTSSAARSTTHVWSVSSHGHGYRRMLEWRRQQFDASQPRLTQRLMVCWRWSAGLVFRRSSSSSSP